MTRIGLLIDALWCALCHVRGGPFWAVLQGDDVIAVCGGCVDAAAAAGGEA